VPIELFQDAPAPLALITAPISSRAWTVYNRCALSDQVLTEFAGKTSARHGQVPGRIRRFAGSHHGIIGNRRHSLIMDDSRRLA
jgi:hypothetical protein